MGRPLDALPVLERIPDSKTAQKRLDAYVYRLIGRWKDTKGREFVFRRDGVLEGVVGAGEIFDAQGRSWGGFGRFRVSVLMPRRLLKDAQAAFEQEAPLKTVVSVHLRPILRSIMEDILSSPIENPAALRGLLSRRAAEAMEKPLLLRGLKLEHFEIARFERTEV